MKLEQEIRQKKFSSEYQKLIVNITFTGSWLTMKNSEYMKPFKLTIQQFNILRILRGQHPEPATVNLLIERMLDKMSNASRIVDKLHVKKLAERTSCLNDRRCVDVRITEKGLKLLKRMDELEEKWEREFKKISVKEAKELNRLLDKLRG